MKIVIKITNTPLESLQGLKKSVQNIFSHSLKANLALLPGKRSFSFENSKNEDGFTIPERETYPDDED